MKKITADWLKRAAGVTLIELMVAMAIGAFLMVGAMTVFMHSRTSFRVNESISRLQENTRFVLDVIEPDIRMASYFGLTSRSSKIANDATPLDPVPAGLGVVSDCGVNWTIDLAMEVDGSNNGYGWACAAFGTNGAQPQADTLMIHRVSEDPIVALQADTMYLQTARFRDSQIFVGTAVPAGFVAATSQTHALMVSGYYVSQNSSLDTPGNPVPSLRLKTLRGGLPGGPQIIDQEILPGVEDFQVQFGVDTTLIGGVNRGSINRYVNPGDPIITVGDPAFLPDAQILAIRIWVRARAERPENGYTDTAAYVYADQNVPAFNDQIRRTVITKTIYLRNARGPV
ncbi:MAG: PilW family protein [Gemmatimonadales bacterium]